MNDRRSESIRIYRRCLHQITTNNALAVAMSGAFNQDAGTTSARQITLDAGSLSNRGGQIVQTGIEATRITVAGALDNSNAGIIASNGNTAIAAGSLTNQGGTIRAAETSDLALTVGGLLDNSNKGVIGAGGNTTIVAGSLNNNAGSVTAVGDLNATLGGAATNVGGTLAANGNTTLVAGTLDNSGGTAAAVNGNLSVTTTGATTNNGGTLQAGGATTLLNSGLNNVGGKVFGNSLSVDTRGNTLNNAQGTLAGTTTVALSVPGHPDHHWSSFNELFERPQEVARSYDYAVDALAKKIAQNIQTQVPPISVRSPSAP